MKILYVEDEIAHVELTQRTLDDNLQDSFVLLHAESLRDAIKVIETESGIDLVLTDLRLPDGSGLDLLKKVQGLPSPPAVVLVTGQGDQEVAVAALKAGAADYLVKQSDYLHRLPVVISNAVAQNRLAHEQAALREAQARFRTLVEQIPAAVYTDLADQHITRVYISPQIEEISGYTPQEWMQSSQFVKTIIHPEDKNRFIEEDEFTNQTGTSFNLEYRILRKDGQIRTIHDTATLVYDQGGTPLYWQGIIFDITKEREAQQAILNSEDRFRRIFHSTPIPTCVVTVNTGRFIDANQAFQNLVGKSLEDLVGNTAQELGFWQTAEARNEFIDRLREQGKLQGLEIRYPNVPDGPRDTLGFYELIDLGGEACLLAMFYDVTEQQKAQKALQIERDFALQVLNNMGQGLTVVDKNSTFEYVNPAYANMLGYAVGELVGKSPTDFTVGADQALLAEEKKRRLQGAASTYESRLVHKDRHEVPVVITGVPRQQNGDVNGAIAVVTDLTLQKQTEQALERQVQELTALHAVATAEAESVSEDEIIAKVTLAISKIYSDVCGILLLDPSGHVLTPHLSYHGADISNWQSGYPITDGITGRSVSTGKIIRAGDVTKEPGYIEIAVNVLSELCVPIHVNDRVIGVINVESRSINAFTEHDEGFLVTIASGLGTALEKLRLFNEEQRRARELDVLYQATRTMTQSLSPEIIGQNLIAIMEDLLGYEYGGIFTLDETYQQLVPLALSHEGYTQETYQQDLDHIRNLNIKPGQGIVGWVLQNGKPIRSGDVTQDSRYLSVRQGIRSELCVPLLVHNVPIGVINIESTKPNLYSEKDENLLSALASSAAIALENARLYREAVRASERRAVLHRISQDIIRFTQDSEQIYKSIHEAAEQLMPCDVFMVSLRNKSNDENIYAYTMENGTRYSLPNENAYNGLPGKVINGGKSVILTNEAAIDSESFPRFGSPKRVRSVLAVPMRIGKKIIGMISAQSYLANSYESEEQSLLEMLATHAATAIENTRLYDETQRRLRELEIINRVSTSLRLTQSVDEMLPILLNEALVLADTRNGSIWLYEPSSNMLVQRIASGTDAKLLHRSLKPGEGIVGYVFTTGEKYISTELKSDPMLSIGNKDSMTQGLSGICIPIQSTVGPVGVLITALEMNRQITEEINLLTILAEITGNAIHRAELFGQSQEQIHRLTTLRDIDAAIASSTDLRVTLNILMDHTLKHLRTDAVDIMLYHPELQSLTYLCSSGFNNPSPSRPLMRLGEGLAGQVVMKGSIEHVVDIRASNEVKRDPMLIREGFVTYFGIPLIVKGQIKGVFEIFHRSPMTPSSEWMQFLQTLAGQAAIAIDNAQLFDHLQRSNQEVTQAYDTTLEGWARALELRDRETEGHTRRVTELTMQLARFMGISDDELVNMYRGVLLHDIGKMGVPDQILRKTGPLIDSEWMEMRKHPEYAFNLLAPIPFLRPALDIPYCHHEHWDGSGYPRGLKGEQIPLSARIFSIVDIWDALLSDRSYRKAWEKPRVIAYLKEISGTILDPRVVSEFFKMIGVEE